MEDKITLKQKTAFEEYKKVISLIQQQSKLFLDLGFTLKKIRDEKLFKYIGDGGFETWGRFLAQPDIGIRPSTAYFYIQIFEEYVNRLALEKKYIIDTPFYKLQKLLPVIRKRELVEAREIIDEMMPLGASDFNAGIKKLKGIEEGGDKPPAVKRCDTCGKWLLLVAKSEQCDCSQDG